MGLSRYKWSGGSRLRSSRSFFKQAIEQGEGSALSGMGYLYMRGLGVEKSYSSALEYFRKGSEKGDASALNGLGLMYLNGRGIPRDKHRAKQHFQTAAVRRRHFCAGCALTRVTPQNNDHADACYNLGTIERSEGAGFYFLSQIL